MKTRLLALINTFSQVLMREVPQPFLAWEHRTTAACLSRLQKQSTLVKLSIEM